jgi:hypothetical protein
LGSIPRSFARTFGVMFWLMSLIRNLLSFGRLHTQYSTTANVRGVSLQNHYTFVRCIVRSLHRSIVARFDRSNVRSLHPATTTPPEGDRWGICKSLVKNPPRPYGVELL